MCSVSMIGDHYGEMFREKTWFPNIPQTATTITQYVTRPEFEELKRQVEEMKALLIRAKDYDERNGEPHCEMDEKVTLLKRVAELVGVDLNQVFQSQNPSDH